MWRHFARKLPACLYMCMRMTAYLCIHVGRCMRHMAHDRTQWNTINSGRWPLLRCLKFYQTTIAGGRLLLLPRGSFRHANQRCRHSLCVLLAATYLVHTNYLDVLTKCIADDLLAWLGQDSSLHCCRPDHPPNTGRYYDGGRATTSSSVL